MRASAESQEQAIIHVENLRHTYDGRTYALDGVSFSIGRGEVFGLLGKNGAGKSTLIKAMTTLIRPTSGTISVLGLDTAKSGEKIRERIGVVQQAESFDFTTVQGNFDIYGMLWGVPKKEVQRRREELIKKFGLGSIRKQRSFDLSGGQKRRVQVAREMMHDVDILFLDEPTVGLDVIMRRELLDSIKEEAQRGLTVVFTTHNLEEADYLCGRIAVVDHGKVIALDTVENLKTFYGGKKTIELTVSDGHSGHFFEGLSGKLPAGTTLKAEGNTAVLLTPEPKEAMQAILELSRKEEVQLEWLNIRKNTLEDVFIGSISREGE